MFTAADGRDGLAGYPLGKPALQNLTRRRPHP